ncbi:hypothetical protein IJ579_04995 [bacterium]|nr:hypothetical protein [bacterium]
MMNAIDEIKRQYVYAVQPVKLFETENSKVAQQNTFHFISMTNKNDNQRYNPFHPNVTNASTAKKLDILG